jgi:hypothetical protein
MGFALEREINEEYIENIVNLINENFMPYIIEMNREILSGIKNIKL